MEEAFQREDVVIRSWLELREPTPGPLAESVERARREEAAALGDRPDFELVRDGLLPDARMSAHLLVYRYRPNPDSRHVLRLHAVFSTGFRTVHAVGESQATVVDALHTPYREVGFHEMWMRPALQSVRCSR